MIFVDTSAWFALFVTADANHSRALRWFSANRGQLFTTDYIVDETLTLLRSSGHTARAISLGNQIIIQKSYANLYAITESDFIAAWDAFHKYSDKEWSFTDCVSLVVMQRLGIATAFAFDHHFKQFGAIQVVP